MASDSRADDDEALADMLIGTFADDGVSDDEAGGLEAVSMPPVSQP